MATNSRFAVAVHVMALIASTSDEFVKSETAALSVRTNPVVIRRILCALARARLVTSQTGAAGGSRLARGPGQITLLDIYRAVEHGDVFAMHPRPNRNCRVGCNIETVLAGILSRVDSAVEQALSKISVEDVLAEIDACMAGRGRA
jgi:Rrf2 family protein